MFCFPRSRIKENGGKEQERLVVLRPETKVIFILLRPINENVSTRLNHFSEQMNLSFNGERDVEISSRS